MAEKQKSSGREIEGLNEQSLIYSMIPSHRDHQMCQRDGYDLCFSYKNETEKQYHDSKASLAILQ